MINVDDEYYSLNDFQKENGLLVIFSCNTCPYVKAWEPRYIEINDLAEEKEIGVVLLNPNENLRESLTEGTESLAAMKEVAEDMNYPFPYLVDENHELADAFGATRTPHIYLFNNADKLVYVGAIDDNSSSADEVEHHWLRNAINELAAGKEITTQKSKAFGCSIKRVK
jgi:thioredoxin-related protein